MPEMPLQKSSRACQRCRSQKSRCLPGSSIGTCASCEHTGTTCVAHVPLKRGIKAQQTIEDLSKQVAALQLALQEQSKSFHYPQDQERYGQPECGKRTLGSYISPYLSSAGITKGQYHEMRIMSDESMVTALQQYNTMAIVVPYSVLVDVLDLVQSFQRSTLLVLAALLVSPNLEVGIAKQLDLTFHRVLADQTLVKGKQNFDILNALVTYLLWFHHRYDPETQQFFQYLQLAKAMVEDLQVGKCLELGAPAVSGLSRTSLARVLAGLYYVDQGTVMLDTMRHRPLMSVSDARAAARCIVRSVERPVDIYAEVMLDTLSNLGSIVPDHHAPTISPEIAQPSPFSCQNLTYCFSQAWYSLQCLSTTIIDHTEPLTQRCIATADKFSSLVDLVCEQPPNYLQTMTIVEWAYMLTILIKMPHLEGFAPDVLSGCTLRTVRKLETYILGGQQIYPSLLEQSKYLWWLESILVDSASFVSGQQDLASSRDLLTTSTYELLERLTERFTGFRKGYNMECNVPAMAQARSSFMDDKFDQILAQWVDLDQVYLFRNDEGFD